MEILYSILFLVGFLAAVSPFAIWAWTNINKAQEVFGILRLKFILWSFVVGYLVVIIDIILMIILILTI